MIKVKFVLNKGLYKELEVKGHANYADFGKDIICAAVSSTTSMLINGLTEVLKEDVNLKVEDNKIGLKLKDPNKNTQILMESYYIELKNIEQEYKDNIKIIKEELQ